MESFTAHLLDVWRIASRHTTIATATHQIAQCVQQWLPLERMYVRRLDVERACLETVGVGGAAPMPAFLPERRDCEAALLAQLLAWCRAGEVAWWPEAAQSNPALAAVMPASAEGVTLLGPLGSDATTYGVVLYCTAASQRLTLLHRRLLQGVCEPLAVALDNDRQLRELTTLREAAEAEKQAVLRRFGRAETETGETIVGAEGRLRPVMERVALVSRSDVPVLILGETGAGKEVISRAIHTRSLRASGPFIRVNCGAIPPDLIDSELFGHEKGSFTGAVGTRRGWFERADEGTLFLDEIGELPLPAQVRLLRVLQEGVFERVGGERSLQVDVRIVAATHRDLATLVQHGHFREDLWYRIAVFPIVLPPLREHPADIAALADHFAQRAAVRFGLTPQRPSPQDIALLTRYAWPGNVRELAAVIDRAAILGAGQGLEIAKALGVIPSVRPVAPASAERTGAATPAVSDVSLDAAMKQHIEEALASTHGRIEGPYGAARVLHINPQTLRSRMRKLGIAWQTFRR